MTVAEFNALILNTFEELKPFALRFTRDDEEANDLCQETLYKAFVYRKNYKPGTNVKAWLYTIMRNIFINHYRRSKRKKGLVQSITAGSEHFWPSSEFHVRVKEINTAIHELPQVLKTVSVLYLEGYKYHEIAKVLNEPIGTIKSRIHFAKKMLQNKIDR